MTQETWRLVQRIAFILSAVVGGVILVLAGLLFFTLKNSPHPSPPFDRSTYEDLVSKGDAAFNNYRYDEASEFYQDAERDLTELTEFENRSPSKNVDRLQRYYNATTLLRARIELTLIAKEVSELQ